MEVYYFWPDVHEGLRELYLRTHFAANHVRLLRLWNRPGGTLGDGWDLSQPQLLAANLALFQPGEADYAHHVEMSQPTFKPFRWACGINF